MKKTLAIIFLTTSALAAQAEGFYLGVGAGISQVSDTTADTNAQLISEVGGTASSSMDKSVNNFRLVGGYKVNENIAIEIGYINTSNFKMSASGTTGNNLAYKGTGKASFSGVDVSAVLRPSVDSGYNNFFGTVGFHNYKGKTSVTIEAGGQNSYTTDESSGTGTMFSVGYDWRIQENLDLRFAVTRMNRVVGDSGENATNYSIGLLKHF